MTEDTIIGIYQGLVNRHKLGRSGPPACRDWISSQSVARTDSHRSDNWCFHSASPPI